ncbi:MAG: hypothetical protein ACKOBF_11595, partial [Limnohabitans sp.]
MLSRATSTSHMLTLRQTSPTTDARGPIWAGSPGVLEPASGVAAMSSSSGSRACSPAPPSRTLMAPA